MPANQQVEVNYEQQAFWRIPEHLQGGVRRYIDEGIPPGHFLTAVLGNNLMESFARADENSSRGLFDLCSYLYNYAPATCHGSPAKVKAYLEAKQKERLP